MQSEFTVLWIDDDKERRERKRGGVGDDEQITVIPLAPMEAASELLTGPDEEPAIPENVDLALVDWYLHTEDYEGDDEYEGDGPSIEGILRDRMPTTPIYAFSGEYGNSAFEREQKRGEDRFALITGPHKLNDSDLIKDLQDYQRIREQGGEGIEGIIDLLDAPAKITEKIQSTLPQEFAQGLPSEDESDFNSSLRFARWVRHEFLEQSGLLWDDVWTSTKVGIDKEQFDEYKSSLSGAKYTGIFSHRNERWWRVWVRDEVFDLADEQGRSIDRLWKDGPELLGVNENDTSTCEDASCDDSHRPQTVAAASPKEKPSFQVHYNCSNIEQSRRATYDDLRVLVKL